MHLQSIWLLKNTISLRDIVRSPYGHHHLFAMGSFSIPLLGSIPTEIQMMMVTMTFGVMGIGSVPHLHLHRFLSLQLALLNASALLWTL
jgi:hypothetical protein